METTYRTKENYYISSFSWSILKAAVEPINSYSSQISILFQNPETNLLNKRNFKGRVVGSTYSRVKLVSEDINFYIHGIRFHMPVMSFAAYVNNENKTGVLEDVYMYSDYIYMRFKNENN